MSDPDERAAWVKSIHESMGGDAPDIELGDSDFEIKRIATPDAVGELRDVLLAFAAPHFLTPCRGIFDRRGRNDAGPHHKHE
jgi:hypothetical protein